MNITRIIKGLVVIVMVVIGLKFLFSHHFFSYSSTSIHPLARPDVPTVMAQEQLNTQLTNETINTSLRKTAMLPEKFISGCMKTSKSCQCIDQQGKKVEVSQTACEKNVHDSSANQFKIIAPHKH